MHVQSQMTSSMFQNEQLNVMKRHDEILEKQEKEDFKKGMVFEKRHEILTRGHPVILHTGVANVHDRSESFPLRGDSSRVSEAGNSKLWKSISSFKMFQV